MLSMNGSFREDIHQRIAATMVVTVRFNKIWDSRSISFKNKYKLYKSLATSILLYSCNTWTLLTDARWKIQGFEMKWLQRLFHTYYMEQKSNGTVCSLVIIIISPKEPLLTTVKRWKLVWFGHVTQHDALPKTVLQRWVEGGLWWGKQKKWWQ